MYSEYNSYWRAVSLSIFKQYVDAGVSEVRTVSPASFRGNLYRFARRHHLNAKAYITENSVVFVLSSKDTSDVVLDGSPKKGRPNG